MGVGAIFNGDYIKLLKDQLKFGEKARILTGEDDPTVVAKDAQAGSLYLALGATTTHTSGTPEEFATITALAQPNGAIRAICCDAAGNVYVGGSFTTINGVSANRIAKWNGSVWSPLSTGLDSTCYALAFDAITGNVYVGGSFNNAGGAPNNYLTAWNGSSFISTQPSNGLSDTVFALKVDPSNGDLYVGGAFLNSPRWPVGLPPTTGPSSGVAKRDTLGNWSTLGTSGHTGVIRDVEIDGAGNVYAGGTFTSINSVTASYVAKWNGSVWSAMGAGCGSPVYRLLYVAGDGLYVGGNFSTVNGLTSYSIAKWTDSAWAAPLVTSSTSGGVFGLTRNPTSGAIYVSGDFLNMGAATTDCLCRLVGTTFSNIGTGATGGVLASTFNTVDGKLYVVGQPTVFNGVSPANYTGSYKESTVIITTTVVPPALYRKIDAGATTNWRKVESSDAFSVSKTLGNVATIAGGALMLQDGRILMTYDGAGDTSADFGVDLSYTVAAGATDVHLYIDLATLGSAVTLSDAAATVYPVTASNLTILSTAPQDTDLTRYVFLSSIDRTSGLVVNNAPVMKHNIPIKFVSPTVYTLMQQLIGSVGTAGQIRQGHVLSASSFKSPTTASWFNLANANDGNTTLAHNLTNNNATPFTSSGILGSANSAVTFNGSSQSLSSTDPHFNPGDADFAAGGWFAAADWSLSSKCLFAQINNGAGQYSFQMILNSGTVNVICWDGIGTQQASASTVGMTNGSWHHIAMVYKASDNSVRLYIDGAFVQVAYLSAGLVTSSSPYFAIGTNGDGGQYFTGSADEFFFTLGSTTDEDIRKIAAYKLTHNKNVPATKQNWKAVRVRSDGLLTEEIADKGWLVDQTDRNSVYVDFSDLNADSIELSLIDNSVTAAQTALNKTFDTGWLSAAPDASYAHGLGESPTAFAILYESTTGYETPLISGDYLSADGTNVYVDAASISLLTISPTHKIRILAGCGPLVVSVPPANVRLKVTDVSTTYSVDNMDHVVRATGSSTYVVTLPTASAANKGQEFIVKSVMNAGVLLTVQTTGAQLIDGFALVNLARFEALRVISNGSGYDIA